ncbi:MAG TPA: ABC transporter permease subunit [Stellaceae bacterium]|nr:ABC transporter permease subunit [Stellaceae bacterium]
MIGLGRAAARALIGVPFLWLALFFLLPLLMMLAVSFAHSQIYATPPYAPVWGAGGVHGTVDNYRLLAADGCLCAYAGSLENAAAATVLCLLIGYPIAHAIAGASGRTRNLLLFLVILPFWTSFLIRVYAWIAILQPTGLVNRLLLWLGLIHAPLPLLYNQFSVLLGLVYSYLPFMILPIYGSLSQLDRSLLEASADLGARPWRSFVAVTLPLSLPGAAAGVLLVFIPAFGEFVIPDLLGGPDTVMVGNVLWQEFFANRDWPTAAAVAIVLVAVLAVPVLIFQRFAERERPA